MDATPSPFTASQETDAICGPALLTTLLHSGLFGVLSVQVYLYYLAFPHDRVYMKCLVYGVYILELIQSVFIVEDGFRIFVASFGDIVAIDRVGTTWLSVPILTAIDTSIVQIFYAHRISVLARSKKALPVVAIIILSFIQLGGGIAVGIEGKQVKYYSLLDSTPKMMDLANASIGIWNVGGVLCDIIIAVCMTYYLSQRGDTTMQATKTLLKKIIRLTIETGTLTAVVGIVSFSLAMIPGTYYYQTPMGIIGKVYANSMLVLINSRMLLGSEETPSKKASVVRFDAEALKTKDRTTFMMDPNYQDPERSVDSERSTGALGSSEEEV